MKPTILLTTAVVLFACNNPEVDKTTAKDSTTTTYTISKSEQNWVPVDSATAMKAWMEYATPGEPQKMLAKSDGNWEGEVTMWMAPGAPPMINKSTTTNKMVLGGRYQVSNFKGSFMGQAFEGMSTMGYDNVKKVFISTWIDNMGTGIMKTEGPWDTAAKSITMTGKMIDPSTGRECDTKSIYTFVDDDHHTMEMFGPDPATGKQFKTMEIKFTRKK